ncbi:MAG TPA: family 20 glycosylhydrolase [Bryobacteraceae bacterium]|nr:family 20 glycosylhydrolase [Bryobacteraceae bacterium]
MIKLAVVFVTASVLFAEPDVMPWPAKISMRPASLRIDATFRVALTGYQEPRLHPAAERLIARLALETGIPLRDALTEDLSQATLLIHCDHAGEAIQQLGEDEGYRLEVGDQQATLEAPGPLGVLRGLETFLQLVGSGPQGFAAAGVTIEDQPRFPWRGLLMDVARHWIPIEVVKRNLDAMAAVKLNVFHWHLSDDQGFRVESKLFPRLQRLGSDGHYYTQQQVRDLIEYASDRGIRVVPEFDVPGHTTSWLVGYPALASAPGPYPIERRWGVFDPTMDPTREATYRFLDSFIGEMAALFPDRYFHIGGDEVNGKQWRASAHIRAFMRLHKIPDEHALQAYFNRRLQFLVAKHGKRMEGWDEILDPDLPKDITIQSWQGPKSLTEAARLGYSAILSSGYYLDHMEPASVLYAVDPLAGESAALTNQQRARIPGGEAAMWAEYVSAENVDSRIWPRSAAIAERLWSPENVRDTASMYQRLEGVSRQLEWLGLTHRSSYYAMLHRLAGDNSIQPLETLADVLEPANLFQRTRTHKYTQQTPLNRLVDAVRPESRVAREFGGMVERMDREGMRASFMRWRDNDARLQPILRESLLLKEDIPLSQDLSRLGSIGLETLGWLDQGRRPPAAWLNEQKTFLENAAKMRSELKLAIAPWIEKLVQAAAR